jgi:hypothetical protein
LTLPTPCEDGELYDDSYYDKWSAAGIAGVWAEENTREAIYAAFRRKETFGTSGPRMKVRFFAGFELPDVNDPELIAKAFANGVPMGGDLLARSDQTPTFFAWVAKDANSAPLQRIQIIKGWVENGVAQERVYDGACSDGGQVNPDSHRCPDNGAQVNLADCSISTNVGASELRASWQDPDYDASQHALYYVRALENPTCRWSTWDAIRAGVPPRNTLLATIHERIWASPIWISPTN